MATKEQKAEYQKRWYEKNKARHVANVADRKKKIREKVTAFVRELKETTPCADCGINYPYFVMDFDHLRDKEYLLSNMISSGYDIESVQKEIDKCDIVCSNCHRRRTHMRAISSVGRTGNS
jgi:5-methylcytosine-specific restriction endonuclease McrA